MRIDYCSLYVSMSKQSLCRTNIIDGFKEMCRKTMSHGVRTDRSVNTGLARRLVNGAPGYRLVQVIPLRRAKIADQCRSLRPETPIASPTLDRHWDTSSPAHPGAERDRLQLGIVGWLGCWGQETRSLHGRPAALSFPFSRRAANLHAAGDEIH